jgi:hypothetical protein
VLQEIGIAGFDDEVVGRQVAHPDWNRGSKRFHVTRAQDSLVTPFYYPKLAETTF